MQLMTNRKIAYVLTLICYREVDYWENAHSKQKALEMSDYYEMLIAVENNLNKYLPYLRYMRMSNEEWLEQEGRITQEEYDIMLGLVYYSRSLHLWNPALKISQPVGDNLAEYLLNGRLKAACDKEERLTDDLMMQINIDVHNRMFTLIESHIV